MVVGAGPAGLAAAYRLSAAAGTEVHLLERAPRVGGLAAGFRHGPYMLDFGPHRLHSATDPVVLADLRALLGDRLERKRRRGRIRLRGRYLPYPVGPGTLLGLGAPTVARLALGALAARRAGPPAGPAASYEAAVVARLGRPLYDLFYGPYAEKVWGQPGARIAADQAERRVNQQGVADLLRLALGRGPGGWYFYPRGGFGEIPAAYARALARRPSVRLDTAAGVERVAWADGRITAITYQVGGHTATEPADHLVWTAPLAELARRLDPPPPAEVVQAAAGLRSRAVVLCYVALARPRVGDADTYYFPERPFPFNRVIEQKRFSACLVPADRTVLGLDIACEPDDAVYRASDEALGALVLPALEEAGLARRAEVLEVFSRRFRSAYPVYELGYAERLGRVQGWLDGLANLWPIGRQGLHLHNNTHHALLMGYRAAEAIASGSRADWPAALAEFAAFRVAD